MIYERYAKVTSKQTFHTVNRYQQRLIRNKKIIFRAFSRSYRKRVDNVSGPTLSAARQKNRVRGTAHIVHASLWRRRGKKVKWKHWKRTSRPRVLGPCNTLYYVLFAIRKTHLAVLLFNGYLSAGRYTPAAEAEKKNGILRPKGERADGELDR